MKLRQRFTESNCLRALFDEGDFLERGEEVGGGLRGGARTGAEVEKMVARGEVLEHFVDGGVGGGHAGAEVGEPFCLIGKGGGAPLFIVLGQGDAGLPQGWRMLGDLVYGRLELFG